MSLNKKFFIGGGALDATTYFNPKLFTGNGSTQSITGVGFAPDLVWIKDRNTIYQHNFYDSIRGATKAIETNTNTAQYTLSGLTSFDSDGFSLGSNAGNNQSSSPNIAWCFKGGGTSVSNSNGSITSSVSANPDFGFSIVEYSGTGSDATIGHGLNTSPQIIFIKRYDTTTEWVVGENVANDFTKVLHIHLSNASSTATYFNNTNPTSTVFSVRGASAATGGSGDFIGYCFHSVDGVQKIGSYSGDGTTTNAINVGFEPRFLLIKVTNTSDNWVLFDNQRDTTNPRNTNLKPNSNAVEADESGSQVNFTSTGFTCVGSGPGLGQVNGNGNTYLYLAIA